MEKILKKELYNVALYFFVFLGVQAMGGVLSSVIYTLIHPGETPPMAETVILAQFILTVVTLAMFFGFRWLPTNQDFFKDLARARQLILLCAIMAVGVVLPATFLEELIPQEYRKDLLGELFKEIMDNPLGYFVVGISAPVVEEMVFRGAIQRAAMRALSPWRAIALSAFLFALMHFNPAQMPHAFLLGLLMGWLCWHTGSIIPGIIVHWVNNTLAYCLWLIVPNANEVEMSDLFNHEVWREALAIVLSLALFFYVLRIISRMKRAV